MVKKKSTLRKQKRTYQSRVRTDSAQSTRVHVLSTARRLFAERGYFATTISAIARTADVSVATITAGFGTKLLLLQAVAKWDVRGDEEPQPLSKRDWWLDMMHEHDPQARLRRYAANVRQIHERTTDMFEIVRSAAAVEPALAALRKDLGESHYQDDRTMAASFAGQQALAPTVTIDEAADLLWSLGSADLYRLLVVTRGWQPQRYEAWLAISWTHAILAPDGPPG